jgi:hypothetical protein
MTRRVFGRVEDEPERRRGQPFPPDLSTEEEGVGRDGPKIFDGSVQSGGECREQGAEIWPILVDRAFGRQLSELVGTEALCARVGEKPVEASRQVRQMESNRGCASGSSPEFGGSEMLHHREHILTHLQDGVRGRLQQRLNSGDRPSKPHLGWMCHVKRSSSAQEFAPSGVLPFLLLNLPL